MVRPKTASGDDLSDSFERELLLIDPDTVEGQRDIYVTANLSEENKLQFPELVNQLVDANGPRSPDVKFETHISLKPDSLSLFPRCAACLFQTGGIGKIVG